MRTRYWATVGWEVRVCIDGEWQHYAQCRIMEDAEEIARAMNELAHGEAYPDLPSDPRRAA